MSTETLENPEVLNSPPQFPLTIAMDQVPAAQVIVEADLKPETLQLIAVASTMLAERRGITIASHDEYATAADQLGKIKGASKSIDEQRKLLTKPLDDKKKQVMDSVRPFVDALTSAETLFKNGMIAFDQEQTRKRELEDAEAERQRKLAAEKLELKAEKAETAGKTEQADVLRMQAASTVVAAPVSFEAPKAKGVSTKKTYSVEVVSLMDLVKAVAAGTVPIQALQADQTFLNKMAVAFKDDFDYPGCKLSVGATMAVRAK